MNFLRRNRLWVAIGLLVAVAALGFGAFFVPGRGKGAERGAELRQKARALAQYAQSARTVSEQWIKGAEELQERWQREMDAAGELVRERDRVIEEFFRDPDDAESEIPPEAGIWKMVYAERTRKLTQKLDADFLRVGRDPLVIKQFGSEWPPAAEMRMEEKKYWIQKFAVDAIAGLNEGAEEPPVPVFEQLRFLKQPERLLHPAHGDVFRTIPFEIQLGATFPSIPRVLHSLLDSEVNFQITSFEVERSPRAGPRKRVTEIPEITLAEPTQRGREPSRRARGRRRVYVGQELEEGPPSDISIEELLGLEELLGGPPPTARPEREREKVPRKGEPGKKPEVELPENLVDVTIRGYVTDYVGRQEKGE